MSSATTVDCQKSRAESETSTATAVVRRICGVSHWQGGVHWQISDMRGPSKRREKSAGFRGAGHGTRPTSGPTCIHQRHMYTLPRRDAKYKVVLRATRIMISQNMILSLQLGCCNCVPFGTPCLVAEISLIIAQKIRLRSHGICVPARPYDLTIYV